MPVIINHKSSQLQHKWDLTTLNVVISGAIPQTKLCTWALNIKPTIINVQTMWLSWINFTKSMAWSTMISLISYSTIFSAPNLVDPLESIFQGILEDNNLNETKKWSKKILNIIFCDKLQRKIVEACYLKPYEYIVLTI